jgi:hypothetical protein
MVEHGDLRSDRDRVTVRHIDGAGAELDASISVARNIAVEVMFSARSVACSPHSAMSKPSSSARMKASRSSRSEWRQSLASGWIGMVKKPSFMRFPRGVVCFVEKSSCAAPQAEIICFNDIDQVS